MAKNRGKQFEQLIREAFEKVPWVSVDRIPDQTMRYRGAQNVCDFIVYRYPNLFYIECKTVHGNTLPFTNIKDNQWNGLLNKSKIPGVYAGVICWWVDKDVTRFIPITELETMKKNNYKSVAWNTVCLAYDIKGKKKRVLYEYDMEQFFEEVTK